MLRPRAINKQNNLTLISFTVEFLWDAEGHNNYIKATVKSHMLTSAQELTIS